LFEIGILSVDQRLLADVVAVLYVLLLGLSESLEMLLKAAALVLRLFGEEVGLSLLFGSFLNIIGFRFCNFSGLLFLYSCWWLI